MKETEINKVIFERISNIEDILEEMNKNIQILLNEKENDKNEQILLMTRFENLADFIRYRYNVVIEQKEKYISTDEKVEKDESI